MSNTPIHLPQGAIRQPDGGVTWRVWAPNCKRLYLVLVHGCQSERVTMQREGGGYYVHHAQADDGQRYCYALPDNLEVPDPASRWQPDGVHKPSAVYSPERFQWNDGAPDDSKWRGVRRDDLVIYELHVGTFTPEGTFAAIIPRLAALRELGVTAIEIMPVSQFPGERNWGYDGVHPYSVQSSYGGPRGLQELIAAAHAHGIGVILDLVYNHLGPEGNYLGRFGPYFTDRYYTPWGSAINYDGKDCHAVRQFVLDNARMWIRDFHADGLRLDAVQTIFDNSPRHILADIQNAVHEEGERRGVPVHVIAETDQNDIRLQQPQDRGGYGLDAVWSDDLHHAIHAMLTGERHSYYIDFDTEIGAEIGTGEHVAKALREPFVRDGSYSRFFGRRHGTPAGDLDRSRFVVCIQNHDQSGNRAQGDRLSTLLSPEALRLATALMLISPCTPMLFMGEEYGETRPFPFFCSFNDGGLIENVRRGRRAEFVANGLSGDLEIPDPQAEATFQCAKLTWRWPDGSPQAGMRRLYAALLAARRNWPALADRKHTAARCHGVTLSIERGSGDDRIVAVANCSGEACDMPNLDLPGSVVLLSTEAVEFGGSRMENDANLPLLPYELRVFGR